MTMANCSSERTKKLITFIAGFLFLLPNGVSWYWGNVSIYVYSYFHHLNKTKDEHMRAPWLLSIYVISWSTAGMVSGYINDKIGRRPAIVLGSVIFNGGLLASYFVFSESLTLLDVTMGGISGFGNGIVHSLVLQTIVEWTVSHIGLATAFMVTSYAVGSVIINQFITRYLNPDNKKVDVVIGECHYFSQQDILHKVPSVFIVLFLFSVVLHVTAFILLRIRETKKVSEQEKLPEDNESILEEGNTSKEENVSFRNSELADIPADFGYYTDESFNDSNKSVLNETDDSFVDDKTALNKTNDSYTENKEIALTLKENEMNETKDIISSKHCYVGMSPRQLLKTSSFYVLWFTMFCSDSAYMCLSNFYKIFGQTWIKDDHFLTNLGTTLAVATVGMRLLWGLLTDVFGMKFTLVTLTSGLALISTGFYFTAQLDKWLFFTVAIVYACLNCGVYVNFIVAVHKLFGEAHFTPNCGLVLSSTIVLNSVFPSATQILLSNCGWFGVFFSVGILNFLALVLIVCLLPE